MSGEQIGGLVWLFRGPRLLDVQFLHARPERVWMEAQSHGGALLSFDDPLDFLKHPDDMGSLDFL